MISKLRCLQTKAKFNRIKDKFGKLLFFNSILSLMSEGFIEFAIAGVLQLYLPLWNPNGEIIGIILGYISLSLVLILLLATIRTLFFKNDQLKKEWN